MEGNENIHLFQKSLNFQVMKMPGRNFCCCIFCVLGSFCTRREFPRGMKYSLQHRPNIAALYEVAHFLRQQLPALHLIEFLCLDIRV